MLRRRRPLLRAAAVGGTAYAVGRHSGRQREEAAQAEADQNQQRPQQPWDRSRLEQHMRAEQQHEKSQRRHAERASKEGRR